MVSRDWVIFLLEQLGEIVDGMCSENWIDRSDILSNLISNSIDVLNTGEPVDGINVQEEKKK